jgi:hypothetical protein
MLAIVLGINALRNFLVNEISISHHVLGTEVLTALAIGYDTTYPVRDTKTTGNLYSRA